LKRWVTLDETKRVGDDHPFYLFAIPIFPLAQITLKSASRAGIGGWAKWSMLREN